MPSKVLLDEPYPDNLPVAACCRSCNDGPSIDEEYVACLLEVAARGFGGERPKVGLPADNVGFGLRTLGPVTQTG